MKIHPIQEQQFKILNYKAAVFLGNQKAKAMPFDSFSKNALTSLSKTETNKKEALFLGLSEIEKSESKFRAFDFEKEGLVLSLNYPKEAFIQDVANILDRISEEEKKKLYLEFNFQLTKNGDKTGLEGHPRQSKTKANDGLFNTREKLNQAIQKFSENNSVQIEGEEELSDELTLLFNAITELYTTVGKKQNRAHDFTLDIHTLCVLQNVMNDPDYETLSKEDKRTLQITALLHDITKKEGINDEAHAETGAAAASLILERLNFSNKKRKDVSKLIEEHEWLKNYNSPNKNEDEKTQYARNLSKRLNSSNLAKMEAILTKADMLAVKKEGAFFERYKKAFYQGKKELLTFSKPKKNFLYLFNCKITSK